MTRTPLESVDLPDGRHLEVRRANAKDAAGILGLFEDLSPLDRQRRFFSSFRADPEFVERLLGFAGRGGACLVAEVTSAGGSSPEIVAEADFAPLPDGDGELSITVSREWRGWLSPFLLDVLLREANRRGVPNLQAEILTSNRPMLALLRTRRHAAIDQADWTTLRTTISTSQRVPSWPGPHERPRVLVELPGGHWHATEAMHEAGFDVIACPGPGPGRPRCPLLSGESCPLIEGADVVVFALRPGDTGADDLLQAHESTGTGPLVIEVRGVDPPPAHEPPAARELRHPTPDQIVDVVRSLLGDVA